MKPTSEMTTQEAACFINLKKAMNDSIIVNDYLENALTLAPNFDLKEDIAYAIAMMGVMQNVIEELVKDLTSN